MATTTDTKVQDFIINKLTQEQYDAIASKSPTEVYLLKNARIYQPRLIPGQNIIIDGNTIHSTANFKQSVTQTYLTRDNTTTINLDLGNIFECRDATSQQGLTSLYTYNINLSTTVVNNVAATYEIHLVVGDSLPTINWSMNDNAVINWVINSVTTPQLTNSTSVFMFRNQGSLIIGNYVGVY